MYGHKSLVSRDYVVIYYWPEASYTVTGATSGYGPNIQLTSDGKFKEVKCVCLVCVCVW